MAKKKKPSSEPQPVRLQFPELGVEVVRGFSVQRSGTTPQAYNVRTFDPSTDRARGGARSGISKFLSAQINGSNPIQLIDHLDTFSVAPPAGFNQFVYAQAVAAGFGLANNNLGTSLVSGLGAKTAYQFGNSCWDEYGNCYVATVNTSAGDFELMCLSTSIVGNVLTWTSVWSNTAKTCATSQQRAVAGMCVAGQYLFVATIQSGAFAVYRYYAATGVLAEASWLTSFGYSVGSVNCLAAIGTTLGIVGYASTTCYFNTYLTTAAAAQTAVSTATIPGTGSSSAKAKVVSDGTAFFYVVAPITTARMVVKIALAGGTSSIVWQTGVADTCNSIAYDTTTSMLLACSQSGTNTIKQINIADGSQTTSFGGATVYEDIGADGQGNFVVWDDSVSSLDVIGYNSSLNTRFPASTLANAIHIGASVSPVPAPVTAEQTKIELGLTISDGEAYSFTSSGKTALTLGGGLSNPVFSTTAPVICGCQSGLNYYFSDGVGYFYYNANTQTVLPWIAANGGTMPIDSPGSETALLVFGWRDRVLLAGFTTNNPQQIYGSALGDPTNWNIFPIITSTTQAFLIDTGFQGYTGLPVNTLIPYDDNTLIIGNSHEVWQLSGDPEANGQMNIITRQYGMAWGIPWVIDPVGQIHFWSNGAGIFTMVPGALPVRISQQIERIIENVNLVTNYVRLVWDVYNQGLACFVTPFGSSTATKNFFWDQRTNAWYIDFYGVSGTYTALQPLAVHTWTRGPLPTDQQIFLGGQDGYIRVLNTSATTDDGTTIKSSVMIPVPNKEEERILLMDMLAKLAETSGPVTWSVFVGETVEQALLNSAVATGTWTLGKNAVTKVMRNGIGVFVQISATGPWAMESIMANVKQMGPVATRLLLGH